MSQTEVCGKGEEKTEGWYTVCETQKQEKLSSCFDKMEE